MAASEASDQMGEKARIDLVDFGPPDPIQIKHFSKFISDQMHMLNSKPSIALVKSNSCDLISHSANDGVTRQLH